MRYRFLLILFVAFSVGCVSSIPEGTPTAKIRFTSDVPVVITPVCTRNESVIRRGSVKVGLKEESSVKMYGTRSDKTNDVIERLIPAERTLPFRIRWGHYGHPRLTSCEVFFYFTPRPNEQYQADYALGNSQCTIKLYQLSQSNGTIKKTEIPASRFEAKDEEAVCRKSD